MIHGTERSLNPANNGRLEAVLYLILVLMALVPSLVATSFYRSRRQETWDDMHGPFPIMPASPKPHGNYRTETTVPSLRLRAEDKGSLVIGVGVGRFARADGGVGGPQANKHRLSILVISSDPHKEGGLSNKSSPI